MNSVRVWFARAAVLSFAGALVLMLAAFATEPHDPAGWWYMGWAVALAGLCWVQCQCLPAQRDLCECCLIEDATTELVAYSDAATYIGARCHTVLVCDGCQRDRQMFLRGQYDVVEVHGLQ